MSRRQSRPATPPSKFVRGIGRIGVPLGVICGLLALAAVAALAYNLIRGGSLYSIVLAASQAIFFGAIAYSVGVEVPRNIRAWDVARQERTKLADHGR